MAEQTQLETASRTPRYPAGTACRQNAGRSEKSSSEWLQYTADQETQKSSIYPVQQKEQQADPEVHIQCSRQAGPRQA